MRAENFADSLYYSNINGNYQRTLEYADSCRYYLNMTYQKIKTNGNIFLKRIGTMSEIPAEIKWYQDGLPLNYKVILAMRNESAVAALALHEWDLYRYNNKVYTQLFKETSADATLGEYCRELQKSETNKNVAIGILVLLLLLIFPAYYFMYYRHRLHYVFCVDRIRRINEILLSRETAEKKLSSIWPLTTDRFPEELQMIVQRIIEALRSSIETMKISQTNIEIAEDECRRVQLEDEKLHVSNSVLDNCLSTLKHETMYYPSRIRQLVDGTDENLKSIAELAAYYKDLYLILNSQAMRQVDAIKIKVESVVMSEILPEKISYSESVGDCRVLGDRDMMKYLFDILQKQSRRRSLYLSIEEQDLKYVKFSVLIPELYYDNEQCLELFTPSMKHLPYLFCRQIIRDTGESTNLRKCGIVAEPAENGTNIIITLAKSNKIGNL